MTANFWLIAYEGHNAEVYNLGNGTCFSVKEIIEVAETVTRQTLRAFSKPLGVGTKQILKAINKTIKH